MRTHMHTRRLTCWTMSISVQLPLLKKKSIFCIKISVMTFLKPGEEYQSMSSYKALNFKDGCLTFGLPLWHDLCSSSPNISSVNLTICLWNLNSHSCWLAWPAEEQSAMFWFCIFWGCDSRTKGRLISGKSSITNMLRSNDFETV